MPILSANEIAALSPLFGATKNAGFIQLRGSSRSFLNPETGEFLSRRQYDKKYGSTTEFGSYERKAKTRKELGIGKPNIRRIKSEKPNKMGRTHNRYKLDKQNWELDARSKLDELRRRFYSKSKNATIYVVIKWNDGEEKRENQTRSIGAYDDDDWSIIRDGVEEIINKYDVEEITSMYLVFVHY